MTDLTWKARWIWGGDEDSPRNEWRRFRKNFDVTDNAEEAVLRISADSRYIAYVNGICIGRGPIRSWPAQQFYDTHRIGHLLKPGGKNTLAVLVMHYGVSNFYYVRGRGGLLAEITLNGEVITATDDSWRTEKHGAHLISPRMSCQQAFAEVFDARAGEEGWKESSFCDSSWSLADVVGPVGAGPWKTLIPRDIPILTEEKLYPSRVESLQRVKPPAWNAAIDLRNAMVPSSADHANQIQYIGYIATMLVVPETGNITLGFPNTARKERVWIDGQLVQDWYGVFPERYFDVHLDAGEHFLLMDVSEQDHGGTFHIAADTSIPFSFQCPLHGGETPFVLVGPFDEVICIDTLQERHVNSYDPHFNQSAGAASMLELEPVREWIRPLASLYYTEHDVFGANVWRPIAESYAVPQQLERCLLATPEYAELPRFMDSDMELIIDFGKQRSGFLGFEIEATKGTVIDFYGIEYMKGEYRQHTYSLDNTLRFISSGGRQRYESPIRRGLRYAVLTIRGAIDPVKLYETYIVQSTYPVTEVGSYQCSDPLLNDIWEISRHTTQLCMEDTFVDCPAYEQTFWIGDSRNEALVNYYVFGATDIVKRCLRLVPGSKYQSPLYLDQVPSGWNSVIPNWTFLWTIACLEYVEHTGDREFAAEMWPNVCYTLEHYLQHLNKEGLLEIRAWNLLDWAPIDQPNNGVVTHQNQLLVMALRQAVKLATEAEISTADPLKFEQAASSLAQAINERLWDDEQSAYIDCIHADGRRSDIFSMQTQVIALLCGVAEGDRKEQLENYLDKPPVSFVPSGSPFMSFFYYEALEAMGREQVMLGDIRQNFGRMIEHGATTCWEMYPNFKENRANPDQLTRSHCHAWSAGPAYFLGRSVLGVKRDALGWSKVRIEPVPCGLSWARGAVPLPGAGTIEVDWRIEDNTMFLRITAPENIELDIRLPNGMTGSITSVRTKRLSYPAD
ncbi:MULTISPECIES: family 78 glycoside hydrolase catalytic domain [unclassified Paenibacillus]|uniref:family 78 glycoside hydrolase catalytic domain n=1 Tax=unclassified Paenibacillus TaxID=185978 RepID=UPI0007BF0009|nr:MULTISPECIES: family 78 glycoside hydrolase catalytic domain [unclassified Paenibacillus]SDK55333.1 Alpha-L-rhamnosidase N-terminal domain-containing protein [Paenibacillus sp. OK060]